MIHCIILLILGAFIIVSLYAWAIRSCGTAARFRRKYKGELDVGIEAKLPVAKGFGQVEVEFDGLAGDVERDVVADTHRVTA